jgi:hypothetical protein
MNLTGDTLIAAPRGAVWAALNDPDVLARCIEGVERLEAVAEDRFAGKMNAKVGPVRATFTGEVQLTEREPPARYVIVGEGKGGVAGFAKGRAEVTLSEEAGGTRLAYIATPQVGGKLAQLGTRLIEGTAKGYAETFFARLKAEVERPPAPDMEQPSADSGAETADLAPVAINPVVAAPAENVPLADPDLPTGRSISPAVWGAVLVLVMLAVVLLLVTGWPAQL